MNTTDADAFKDPEENGQHLTVHPMVDRTIDRLAVKTTADERARTKGFADYTAELDADYEAWRERAGVSR